MKLFKMLYLLEARKNPEINIRKTAMDALYDIYTDVSKTENINDLFVSFMNVNKTGVNIQTSYNTPSGIYCYPLSYILSRSKNATNSLQIRPFPNKKVNFIKIFKINNKKNIFQMTERITNEILEKCQQIFDDFDSSKITTFRDLWRYVYLDRIGINSDITSKFRNASSSSTTIFRKLGIDGFIDNGTGTIHPNEPEQAVFLNATCLTTVDVIKETSSKLFYSNLKNNIKDINELVKPIQILLGNMQHSVVLEGIQEIFKILKDKNFLENNENSIMWYLLCKLFVHYFVINQTAVIYDEIQSKYIYNWFHISLTNLSDAQRTDLFDLLHKEHSDTCVQFICSYQLRNLFSNYINQIYDLVYTDENFSFNVLSFFGIICFYAGHNQININKTFDKDVIKSLLDKILDRKFDKEYFEVVIMELKNLKVLTKDDLETYRSRLKNI